MEPIAHMTHREPSIVRRAATLAAFAAALGAAACSTDDLLNVQDVDVLTPGALNSKAALPTILNSTISNFQVAVVGAGDQSNGGHEGMINLSALLSDEFIHAETFPDRQLIDQRKVEPGNGSMKGVFFDLAQARAFADFASGRYNQFDPGAAGQATVLNLAGFAYLTFAENFCSGVPFSTLTENGVEFGDPQTTAQVLTSAIAKFDSAITIAGAKNDATQLAVARIGKARAMVDQGNFAALNTSNPVSGVPTTFVYALEGSTNTTRQNNGIWNYTVNFFGFSAADDEGGNGLPFLSAGDDRVPFVDTGDVGFDGETPYIAQQKYPDKTSDTPLATGIEARLIEAEVALKLNDNATFLAKINAARAAQGLGSVTLPGTARAREDLLFRERAFSLYLTGHRLSDLRRLVRQYGRTQDTVFPTGNYHKGGTYGSDVNFPVSADEKNNPKFSACIDRNA
jgi:hypothetical protein